MYKIRRDDDVIVLAGKDKGKRGKVLSRVSPDRVVVGGVNVAKKAVRPNPATNDAGGIVDKEMSIHVSNLALFNAAKGAKDGVRFQVVDGKKVRVYKSTGEVVKVL